MRVEDVVGVVESVDESGALIIRTSIGSTERVIAGDVMIDPTSDDRSDAS